MKKQTNNLQHRAIETNSQQIIGLVRRVTTVQQHVNYRAFISSIHYQAFVRYWNAAAEW